MLRLKLDQRFFRPMQWHVKTNLPGIRHNVINVSITFLDLACRRLMSVSNFKSNENNRTFVVKIHLHCNRLMRECYSMSVQYSRMLQWQIYVKFRKRWITKEYVFDFGWVVYIRDQQIT